MVRHAGTGKQQGVLFYLYYFIGILGCVAAAYEAYLVVGAAVIGHGGFLLHARYHIAYVEHVEVSYFAGNAIGEQVPKTFIAGRGYLLVEVVEGSNVHGCAVAKFKGRDNW